MRIQLAEKQCFELNTCSIELEMSKQNPSWFDNKNPVVMFQVSRQIIKYYFDNEHVYNQWTCLQPTILNMSRGDLHASINLKRCVGQGIHISYK